MATLSADRITRPDSIDANIPNPGLEVCCSGTLTYYLSNLAASNFVDAYYQTLESSTGDIESFYMPHTTMRGKALPSIIWNGNVFYDPEKVAKLFREKMPETHYSIQNYDCQLLNYHYVAEDQHPNPETAMNLVILIVVSGTVTYGYGTARLPVPRGFSDSIVLVPNPAAGFKAHGKPIKDWLIQSQTFRHVV